MQREKPSANIQTHINIYLENTRACHVYYSFIYTSVLSDLRGGRGGKMIKGFPEEARRARDRRIQPTMKRERIRALDKPSYIHTGLCLVGRGVDSKFEENNG